jgi:hypothetical protein
MFRTLEVYYMNTVHILNSLSANYANKNPRVGGARYVKIFMGA